MSAWSNIEVSHDDVEITHINKMEESLGDYQDHIRQIRELITRFEVCHFKYPKHLDYIRKSIEDLHPGIYPGDIGQNHIQHGDQAWKRDNTGRTLMGQEYLWSLHNWMDNSESTKLPEYNHQLANEVKTWLGEKNPDKERLVRLLIARLTWDWKALEKLSQKSMEEIIQEKDEGGLEFQINRMDICHYAFPGNLINVIRGIGKNRPVENFEGCGSCNPNIKNAIYKELAAINSWLISRTGKGPEDQGRDELSRIWLFSCLAKTIKEQAGLTVAIHLPSD